ncbi:uncharacterized protein F4807DRAFT_458125 [Annulohypoxylon truncatum]|uniref:uncharacterized protein n=1 Tax=Annulohypoxylon truncatum TaxID=327061 RepID=UPI0020080D2C|nr:uncharacterized protein F4807DRAFT_458125 [Annulohypoxylon truncatum]KAI1211920.1 hypothetical protein F4807DRAFT_458125 [Annulohypoxylon truncatum]
MTVSVSRCPWCKESFGLQLLTKIVLQYKYPNDWKNETNHTVEEFCPHCRWNTENSMIETIAAVESAPREMFRNTRTLYNILKTVILNVGYSCREMYDMVDQLICQLLARMIFRWRREVGLYIIHEVLSEIDRDWPSVQWGECVWKTLGRCALTHFVRKISKAKKADQRVDLPDIDIVKVAEDTIQDGWGIEFVIEDLDEILSTNGLLDD